MTAVYPHHAHIEPTTLCNLKCESCGNEAIPPSRRGRLTLENLKALVEKNRFLKDVSLIGLGEPLLNPELGPMLSFLNKRDMAARTATNGMMPDQVNLKEILENVDELIISFDSDRKESFQAMRKGADFGRVVKNVQRAVHLKRAHRLPVALSFQTVISRKNFDRLTFIPPLAKELGIDKMRFSSAVQYHPGTGRANGAYAKIRDRIGLIQEHPGESENELKRRLAEICGSLGLSFSFSGFAPRYRECWWPGRGIFITHDGFVTPCCVRMDPGVFHFGNLFHQTFDEIRRGALFQDFLYSYRKGLCPEICKECPA